MSAARSSTQRVHAHQVLGAWGETLLKGRRVAVIGDSASGLAEQIANSCGRRVHAYDPDTTRAAASLAEGRSTKVTYCALTAKLDLREGAYDAVVVPDLDALPDAKAAISHARELLSPRGLLLLASRASGALDYYALYDAVADSFEEVTMLGRAPFAGYTVAAFGAEGDPTVMIDSSLVASTEPPQWFVVAASDQPLSVEGYTLVQLPAAAAEAWVQAPRQELADAADLAEARLQCSLLTTELRRIKDSNDERAQEQASHRKLEKNLSLRVVELEAELKRTAQETNAQKRAERRQSSTLEKKLKQTQLALEDLTSRADDTRQQAEDSFQEELDTMLERIAELEEQLETQAASASAKEKQAGNAEKKARDADARASDAAKKATDANKQIAAAQARAKNADQRASDAQKNAKDAQKTAKGALTKVKDAENKAKDAENKAKDAENKAKDAENKAKDAENKAKDALTRAKDELTKAKDAENEAKDALAMAKDALTMAKDADKRIKDAESKAADALTNARDADKRTKDAENKAVSALTKARDADKRTKDAENKAVSALTKARDANKRIKDAENKAADALTKAKDADRKAKNALQKAKDADKKTNDALTKAKDADNKAKDNAKQRATASKVTERRASQNNGVDHYAAEVVFLEQKLQERGSAVVGLQTDLREAERTGRELLARVIAMTASASLGESSMQQDGLLTTLSSGQDSQRPDANEFAGLQQRCTRYEADLQAANWKAEALVNELAQIRSTTPTDVEKLEAALRHTHDELAKQRQQNAASSK